ncbi:Starch-binding associating with outer membrane [Xylanibacter ruminicola]|uniref:Starch-binding associating with outer membrane n=2 Tax=Bacteroidales TaxID=171549 RepID=A0A1H5XMJ7_XYLRU|nr:Starch-binding associating with outer membrane [Xylanibacter ruminicola]SEV93452.1 Starch-binding associating with outer membrane [Prevotella sp. khp7]
MAIAMLFAVGLTSCEDFLDSENYTQANSSNYPASAGDLNKELAALYGVMNQFSTTPLETPWFVGYIMSDDANGAGGTGDVEAHAVGHLMANKEDLFDNAWHNIYVGIARANAIIYAVDAFDWTGQEATRNQLLGEAYFMRGLFYLWGVQFWGDIPAYWASAAPDPCPQESAENVIMPHILADFTSAANLMTHGMTTRGDGHATKGAAEGYLARAYMFYEGFYKKAGELANANLADVAFDFEQEGAGASLSKAQVVAFLEDAINNGGYKLIEDFRLLWQYTNEYTIKDYAFVNDLDKAGKVWAGNGNEEEMFQIQYMNAGSWNGTIGMGFVNQVSLYTGLRCDDDGAGTANGDANTLPFGQGWGQGTINANLWDEWSDSDPRKKATILDAQTECEKFVFTTSCSEDAGYYNKKWMPITCSKSTWDDHNTAYTWWGVYRTENTSAANNNKNSFQGDHFADIILLRLADVMLMHSELTGDATQMNKVRARAGLPATTYSWKNIKDERRFELAGEGLRFNDLRRWSGKDGGASCEAALALQKQDGSRVNYTGHWTVMHHGQGVGGSSWAQRYADTDGFVMIPPQQISIVGNPEILKQNPGWGASATGANMSGCPVYD